MQHLAQSTWSKDELKYELIQIVAQKWQVSVKEVMQQFDPLLMLMIDVVTEAHYKVFAQLDYSYNEILKGLVEKYNPQQSDLYYPYTSILAVQPIEHTTLLSTQFEFKTWTDSKETCYFSPLMTTSIKQIQIDEIVPIVSIHSNSTNRLLWIGRKSSLLDNISGWQCYVNSGVDNDDGLLLYALKNSVCYINKRRYKVISKHKDYLNCTKNERDILGVYQPNILAFEEDTLSSDSLVYDSEIESIIARYNVPKDELLVVLWHLPIHVQFDTLKKVKVFSNPVIVQNKRYQNVTHKVQSFVNIASLPLDGQLLEITHVENEQSKHYTEFNDYATATQNPGTYILKSKQVGAMSSDEMLYLLQHLQDQVNENAALFDKVSNAVMYNEIRQVQKLLLKIKDQLKDAEKLKPNVAYLSFVPYLYDKYLHISYVTENAETVRKLKPNAVVSFDNSVLHKIDWEWVEWPRRWAMAKLGVEKRIITKYDIRVICIEIFKDYLKDVIINNTTKVPLGVKGNAAMHLVIEILLSSNYPQSNLNMDRNYFTYVLQEYSVLTYPFYIDIKIK